MLTSKQRAGLRSMAHSLDPILHVGKGELSDALIKQADDALTARELFKGRVLETCPLTAREAAERIAAAAQAEVVQVIGRTFVLYRRNEKEPKIRLPRDTRR
ncbi:MAG TPA: ribosome assembly RNA-binding protein YhbY [Firmicutes bacterium]|nr:ribosome assembly RNA-binding protein YhbY [Bacillota bacterium]